MTLDTRQLPTLVLVHVAHSSNTRVPLGGYPSLDAADAAVTRAFAGYTTSDPERSETISVRLVWADRHHADEHLRLGPSQVAAASAAGIGLLRYLLVTSAKAAASGTTGRDLAPFVVEQLRERGRELLRRLLADDAGRRNAGVPHVERVVLSIIKGTRDLHRAVFDSIANADARLAHDFPDLPATDDERTGWVGGVVYWSDREETQVRFYVTRTHLLNAQADGGILRHGLLRDARLEAAPTSYAGHPKAIVKRRTALGRALLARIEADAAAPRNAGPAPRIVRVEITEADSPAVRKGTYLSIAHADAMLDRAYATVAAPEHRPFHLLEADVIWSDGYYLRPRTFVDAQLVRDAATDGGILRHVLLRAARAHASPDNYQGARPDVIAQHVGAGRAVLARLEADTDDDDARRNAMTSTWASPSLLPDPSAAIERLRERFAGRRRMVEPRGADVDGAAYPATNVSDVRYVSNYVTVALRNDLRTFDEESGAIVWNHWRAVRDTIETLCQGKPTDEYADNEGFWTRQLPALVRLLDDTRAARTPRNGRLTFRPVGRRGEPYPAWVADLRGRSGVYVIRSPGEGGDLEVAYVGSSSADRLHATLTRHFQSWRRYKGFWRGGFTEGHDPGLTYDRDTAEAAVIVTPAHHALELERRLIGRLRPRDNLVGQVEEEVPF